MGFRFVKRLFAETEQAFSRAFFLLMTLTAIRQLEYHATN